MTQNADGSLTTTKGILRLCCADPANLRLLPPDPNSPPGLEVRVCRTCDRRHITMNVDPVHMGITGTG